LCLPPDWRQATLTDIPKLNTLLVDAFASYVARLGHIADPDHWITRLPLMIAEGRVLAVEQDGQIVAVLTLSPQPPILTLDQIAVTPRLQSTGLGRRIMTQLDAVAHDAGYTCIRLHTAEIMSHLLRFYQSLGYQITRRGPAPHGLDGFQRAFFEKILAPIT